MRHQPVHRFKGCSNEENNLCIQCGTNLCIGSRDAQMINAKTLPGLIHPCARDQSRYGLLRRLNKMEAELEEKKRREHML
ncbi:hypothetical protein RHMOL_Rhmol10G0237900 [Rhododendron molle]|uniref:Uncharacterized protein n=1 Tax=Rhododendron molle TaxID=49168 RepID=A0ACC0M616_RHOML|nr:hypothetical protein RHMOL_Rhmol10G0237900 [Rhododendron molle]